MPKPIRRSDGSVLRQSESDCSDDILIEKTISALTGEIQRKQKKIVTQPAVSRNGEPLIKQAESISSTVNIKTWEELKQELINQLNRASQDYLYNDIE